jgi:hypothetical protein
LGGIFPGQKTAPKKKGQMATFAPIMHTAAFVDKKPSIKKRAKG